MLITPSILNADFGKIANEIERVARVADWLHLDVMDGHFVPNLSFGPAMVQAVRKYSDLPLDVHLMIESPEKWIQLYIDAGANNISFHFEATEDAIQLADTIRSAGISTGLAIKPATPFSAVSKIIEHFDLLLVMTVEPGFGGQSFMPNMLDKIKEASEFFTSNQLDIKIQADGGINLETIRPAFDAGATIFVAGSVVYNSATPAEIISKLRNLVLT